MQAIPFIYAGYFKRSQKIGRTGTLGREIICQETKNLAKDALIMATS